MSTPILPFAVWAPGTNQNSVPANDNSLRHQILNGLVISDSTDAQPGSPADGDIYIITGAATGTQWATFDEFDLAIYDSGTWYAYAPVEGIVVNIAEALHAWDGAAYVAVGGGGGGGDVVGPASATANAVALFDGTTGKLLKDGHLIGTSGATIPLLNAANTWGAQQITLIDGSAISPASTTAHLFQRSSLTTSQARISVVGGNASTGTGINFGDTDSENVGAILYDHTNEQFRFRLNGVNDVYQFSATALTLPATPAISDNTTKAATTAYADRAAATIPQNSQSAAYTLVAADAGKHIYHPSSDANARTFTIPANASVAYPIGTALTFINETSQVVTIAITTDTLVLAGTGTTGSRSLAQYGVATAIKVTSTRWIISGPGLT